MHESINFLVDKAAWPCREMATVAPDFHINTTKTPHMGSSNCESTQVLFLAFGNSLSLNIPLCACQFHDADIILSSSQNPTTNSKDRYVAGFCSLIKHLLPGFQFWLEAFQQDQSRMARHPAWIYQASWCCCMLHRDNSPCQPLFSKEMQDMKCFCKRIIGNILTWLSKYADMDHQQMQPCGWHEQLQVSTRAFSNSINVNPTVFVGALTTAHCHVFLQMLTQSTFASWWYW